MSECIQDVSEVQLRNFMGLQSCIDFPNYDGELSAQIGCPLIEL